MSKPVITPELDFPLPIGFKWAGIAAGIKYAGRKDVGLVVSNRYPCACAATFTQNIFCAAPVLVSRQLLSHSNGLASGAVVNSGCANAATGTAGEENARTMARLAANPSHFETAPCLVCSTGTIGVQLPMEKITQGISMACGQASDSREAFLDFASSILTTDTVQKIAWQEITHAGQTARILACAKGSGMMQPDMATMLAFVVTDAQCQPDTLQKCFSRVIEKSLNCMTVDGDTSTNDTAFLFANGASELNLDAGSEAMSLFESALTQVMQSIATQLARDGEGATKLIEIEVAGASSFENARQAALAVANSPLVKTAIYGKDANWGRIAMALGKSGVTFNPDLVDIRLGDLELFRQGAPIEFDEEAALEILSQEIIRIETRIGTGDGTATVWTCDLTEKYIEINGSYRT